MLGRGGVGELIADFVNDFLPDLVFEEFGVGGSAEGSRLQNLGLLSE